MADEQPTEKPTLEIPKADPVEIGFRQLKNIMEAGFRETNANIDLVSGDLKTVKGHVRDLQEWRLTVEKAPTLTSDRVREVAEERASKSDLEHQAKLSEEIAARLKLEAALAEEKARREKLETEAASKEDVARLDEKIDTKTDAQTALIIGRLDSVLNNPRVKMLAVALFTALTTWLAAKGIHIQ